MLEQQASRLQEQVRDEKKRCERMAQECAKAERTAAEASAAKSKTETQLFEVLERTRKYVVVYNLSNLTPPNETLRRCGPLNQHTDHRLPSISTDTSVT